jgi:hypothetical protein
MMLPFAVKRIIIVKYMGTSVFCYYPEEWETGHPFCYKQDVPGLQFNPPCSSCEKYKHYLNRK